MPQVELLARRLHRRCPQVELDDLIQAGATGLIQAVDRFDKSRGCMLKTIAEHRIRGALLDYLRQIDPLPRNVRRFQKLRDVAIAELVAAGEETCHMRIAELLGVSLEKYRILCGMIAAAETVSLNDPSTARRLTG
jgi:RNA polymerase sigma factor for flagellar operon FliA